MSAIAAEAAAAALARPGSRWLWAGAVLALLAAAFALDVRTGTDASATLFYMVGVAVAAWWLGRAAGLAAATVGAIEWALAVRATGGPDARPGVFQWNLAVEWATYVSTAVVLARIRRGVEAEHRLVGELHAVSEALARETRAVGELQHEMLPASRPSLAGWTWEVHYETSSDAGGDYYDFFRVPPDRLGVLVADASGHGPQAAMLMAMLRVLLHTCTEPLAPPDRVLARLAGQFARTVPAGRFVTTCYLVLDPGTGRYSFALAGHPPPLVLRAAGGPPEPLPLRGGPPLGVLPGSRYTAGTGTLGRGDTLVVFTDGLTECADASGELFGDERLAAALAGGESLPLPALRARLLARMAGHAGGARLEDDVTLLLLRREG